jgi:hypothetical protein
MRFPTCRRIPSRIGNTAFDSRAGWVFEFAVVVALAGRARATPQRSARLAMPDSAHPMP